MKQHQSYLREAWLRENRILSFAALVFSQPGILVSQHGPKLISKLQKSFRLHAVADRVKGGGGRIWRGWVVG